MNAKSLRLCCLFIATLFLTFSAIARQPAGTFGGVGTIAVPNLPREARQTLDSIRRGPPYPYAKDGVVFGNYEGLLPRQPRGYYHEFTVKSPGSRSRGAQRLIVGGRIVTSHEVYYTRDHYASFLRLQD